MGETPWLVRLRPGAQLYDLDRDSLERHNLVSKPGYRSTLARMEELLGAAPQLAASEGEPALAVDADLLARLRALGYLPPAR